DGDPGRAPLPLRVRGHARRPADVEAVERDLRHRTREAGRAAVHRQQEVEPERADSLGLRMTDELEPEPKSWNIWLTLMVISIAVTIAVAVLEYVGVFRDLGVILSAVGLALLLGFGLSRSSQRTVETVRLELRVIRRDLTRGFAEMSLR